MFLFNSKCWPVFHTWFSKRTKQREEILIGPSYYICTFNRSYEAYSPAEDKISLRNILTDTSRVIFNQMSGNLGSLSSWHINQSHNRHSHIPFLFFEALNSHTVDLDKSIGWVIWGEVNLDIEKKLEIIMISFMVHALKISATFYLLYVLELVINMVRLHPVLSVAGDL